MYLYLRYFSAKYLYRYLRYVEKVSYPALATASTHYAYPQRDSQAELARAAGLNTDDVPANGHPSQL